MILVVDDDKSIRLSLNLLLKRSGYDVVTAEDAESAILAIREQTPELIIMDMNFSLDISGNDGLELLQRCKILIPEVPVILITAWGSIPLAVEGIKKGAFDFITKPWDNRLLLDHIETAIKIADRSSQKSDIGFDRSEIIGKSRVLTDLLEQAARVAPTNAPVLILGENGTGKELIAKAIHSSSKRSSGPFVMVNLGGISQSLFESEMFGHAKGAFTGAVSNRKGRFELADNGTIFLDEIGDLDLTCQVKMLRVLQQHTFEPLGDSHPRHVDIRVISATNADLCSMVAERTFREDLFYRLNLITLKLPPLRERRDDIPLLVNHFARLTAKENGIDVPEISSDAISFLSQLPYPGNIRELKNIVERTILININNKQLDGSHFRMFHVESPAGTQKPITLNGSTLDDIEKNAILSAIDKYDGNLSKVALSLGITRQSLYRRIEKYEIKI